MSETPSQRSHFPALDGLRGIAILLVVFYHNFGFIRQSYFGWLGVDLFFVLSGYLITSILLKEVGKKGFPGNFYRRRILRIFPLYYLTLVLFLVVFPLLGLFRTELRYFLDNQVWLWTYLQNWLYSLQLTADAKLLTHFWSLAVEEQFYLFWPFVILWVRSPRKLLFIMLGLLLIVLAGRSALWFWQVEDLNYTTLYTFTRIDGICIGSILALLLQYRPRLVEKHMALIVSMLAGLNFLFYFLNRANAGGYPYFAFIGYTTFAVLFALLVHEVVTTPDTTLVNRLLSFSPLRFFGKISYGFYVFHWPVFFLLNAPLTKYLYAEQHLQLGYARVIAALCSTLLALGISWLSYRYFESYFLKRKSRYN